VPHVRVALEHFSELIEQLIILYQRLGGSGLEEDLTEDHHLAAPDEHLGPIGAAVAIAAGLLGLIGTLVQIVVDAVLIVVQIRTVLIPTLF